MQKAPARSTRIRLGYYRKRRIVNVENTMEKYRRTGKMDDDTKSAFAALNDALMKLLPKRQERRGVR